jgi:hypothetical protein
MSSYSYKIQDVDRLTIRNYVVLLRIANKKATQKRRESILDMAYAVRLGNAEQKDYEKAVEALQEPLL